MVQNINIKLIGKIQLKNINMKIIAANHSNIKIKDILKTIPQIKSVDGRLQKIGNFKNRSKVILDYAHTPEALKTCFYSKRAIQIKK